MVVVVGSGANEKGKPLSVPLFEGDKAVNDLETAVLKFEDPEIGIEAEFKLSVLCETWEVEELNNSKVGEEDLVAILDSENSSVDDKLEKVLSLLATDFVTKELVSKLLDAEVSESVLDKALVEVSIVDGEECVGVIDLKFKELCEELKVECSELVL